MTEDLDYGRELPPAAEDERDEAKGVPDEVEEDDPVIKDDGAECYELPKAPESRTRLWSVISIVLSALSVLLCPFFYVSIPLAVLGVGFSMYSKYRLGYFDRLGTWGLIVGLVGVVFGIFCLIGSVSGVFDLLFGK